MLKPYSPETYTDFSDPQQVAAFEAALAKVKSEMGKTYPMIIGGQKIVLDSVFPTVNPARPDEVLAYFPDAPASYADAALDAATEAFHNWQYVAPMERARYLLRAAAEMRRRRHEFSAVMVLEVSKSWAEADADTAESIDFLDYYARQMVRIADSSHLLSPYTPEQLQLQYIPLGVGVVIPPWNFPNAILAGMTAATIVAGNTAVLKPAEQSPWMGYKVAELFWEQGLPAGVLNFVTSADGAVLGEPLVQSPKTRFVVFTGSRQVGTMIYEKAAKVQPGQKWLKRVVAEMGGKDAIVVDDSAKLAEAAQGIVAAAFGFQGQKCSAGSRAIVLKSVYDEVVARVLEEAQKLRVAAPDLGPDVNMGAVIDPEAREKILSYIAYGRESHTLLHGGSAVEGKGYFIQPTIFGNVPWDDKLAQDEIFGPVLAIIPAEDYDDALRIANSTEYGLTGAVYSQNRAHLERARREFHVGNLYLNRKCTGALVGVHPFGGFNMSGTDSKAGGPDYLLLFTQAKTIAEKL